MDVANNVIQDHASHGHCVSSNKHPVEIIAVPLIPCHSHLDQLLHLSCLISSTYNLPVHFATTATHLRQAKLRFSSQTLLQNPHIHFHEFPNPHFLNPPPNPYSSTKYPSHLQSTFEAAMHLRQPMAEFLREISATARRVVVIHDAFMSYVVQDVATLPNAESYMFNCIPVLHSLSRELNDLESLQSFEELKAIPSSEYGLPPEFLKPSVYFSPHSECFAVPAGTIFNSCRSIEGTFIDLLAKQMKSRNKQIWAVGPLNLGTKSGKTEPNSRHKCLEWLDKQAPKSVLYVSFGTSISMKDEEIKELAIGLEQSKHKFIWLVRHADTGDIFAGDVKTAKLPEGFEERVKQFGLVVRDWAPQVEILGHPSTGGFMSHCGWHSCLESIAMGVPIAAWPMHTDQPRNAFLVTNILKVGLAVNTSEQGEEIVTSSTIASVVKRLMESKEGEEMGKRAAVIAGAVQQAVKEGGDSRLELDSFIAHITR